MFSSTLQALQIPRLLFLPQHSRFSRQAQMGQFLIED